MSPFHPVHVPLLVAEATDVKNRWQSQKHACVLLKPVLEVGRGMGNGTFAGFVKHAWLRVSRRLTLPVVFRYKALGLPRSLW